MKLPFALPFGKKEEKDYILALLLCDEKVTAVIFEEANGKIRIANKQDVLLPDNIESLELAQLLDSLDKAISSAESVLPANIETKKVIFGLKENWVTESQIKREYLSKLKKITEDFGLTPLGFLVIHEALAHLLKIKEGVPVSAILLEAGQKTIAISILRGGKVIETKRGTITDLLPKATDSLLHHFTNYEVLPSRLIIFGGAAKDEKDNDRVSQQFIAHTWSKSLPFLHVPQITVLPKHIDAECMIFGTAGQLGLTVVDSSLDILSQMTDDKDLIPPLSDVHVEKPEPKKKEGTESEAIDFGFVKGSDIAQEPPPPFEQQALHQPSLQTTKEKSTMALAPIKKGLAHVLHMTKHVATSLPTRLSNIALRQGKFIGVAVLLGIVAITGVAGYFLGLGANVVLSAKPKVVEEENAVIFATNKQSDFGKKVIAAQHLSVSQEASATTKATGKKEVGDMAKGTITILSSLPNENTIKEGTIVTSANGLEFTIDEGVKIASSSGLSDLKTNKVSVTAKIIGKEYNLPSGTKFTIGSFDSSQLEAKNDAAFAGGSKKEVTVVTKEDRDLLAQNIVKQNTEKAKAELAKKLADDETLLPLPLTGNLEKEEYSKKADEEADSVTLKATIVFDAVRYKKTDIKSFAQELFALTNKDTTFSQDSVATDVKDVKKKNNNEVSAKIMAKASFIPKIDTAKVQKEIAGKSFDDARNYLTGLAQITDVSIRLSPPIPFLPKLLPRMGKNITIEVENTEK